MLNNIKIFDFIALNYKEKSSELWDTNLPY